MNSEPQTAPHAKPRIAVFKFASCDGCQLCLLDCEDELLAVAERGGDRPLSRSQPRHRKGPYDIALVEGSITTRPMPSGSSEIRRQSQFLMTIGACATAGGIQALRNWDDVTEYVQAVYARPEYISTLATSTAIAEHVAVDFELRGCPIDKHQLLEVIAATAGRAQAAHAVAQRLPGLQAAGHGVRDGGGRDGLSGPRHPSRLRRDLSGLRSRLLRLLRTPWKAPNTAAFDGAVARCWGTAATQISRAFRSVQRVGLAVPQSQRGVRSAR